MPRQIVDSYDSEGSLSSESYQRPDNPTPARPSMIPREGAPGISAPRHDPTEPKFSDGVQVQPASTRHQPAGPPIHGTPTPRPQSYHGSIYSSSYIQPVSDPTYMQFGGVPPAPPPKPMYRHRRPRAILEKPSRPPSPPRFFLYDEISDDVSEEDESLFAGSSDKYVGRLRLRRPAPISGLYNRGPPSPINHSPPRQHEQDTGPEPLTLYPLTAFNASAETGHPTGEESITGRPKREQARRASIRARPSHRDRDEWGTLHRRTPAHQESDLYHSFQALLNKIRLEPPHLQNEFRAKVHAALADLLATSPGVSTDIGGITPDAKPGDAEKSGRPIASTEYNGKASKTAGSLPVWHERTTTLEVKALPVREEMKHDI